MCPFDVSVNVLFYWHCGSVVECPLCDREVAGSIPGRVIPKPLKMVLAALSLSITKVELELVSSVSVMWLGGITCQRVWGVIFQWSSTLKVTIELPATSRHRRDITEWLLKATLSQNQTKKQTFCFLWRYTDYCTDWLRKFLRKDETLLCMLNNVRT